MRSFIASTRFFYYLSLVAALGFTPLIHSNAANLRGLEWAWPAIWLGDAPSMFAYYSTYLACVFTFLIAAVSPNRITYRVAAAGGWLVLIALVYPYGYIGMPYFGWPLVALVLISSKTEGAMSVARALCLAQYCSAGLWKLRASILGFDRLAEFLPNHLAITIAEGSPSRLGACEWLAGYPTLSAALWIGATIFEVSTGFWILKPELDRVWGFLLFGLHFIIAMLFGLEFAGQALLLGFLFILYPSDFFKKSAVTSES